MAVNWNEYELVLEASERKENEVTGETMGDTSIHTCPVNKLVKDKLVPWEPGYGGYEVYEFTFAGVDDEAVHLVIYRWCHQNVALKPGEEWSSGWYSFGSWDFDVRVTLRKIKTASKEEDSKPFFVHTYTDDGCTSDYSDAKEAYENR